MNNKADSHTEHAECEADHNEQSLADFLEVPQQHEEDDHDRHDEGPGNLGTSLVVGLILTTIFYLHALRQLEVGETLHDILRYETIILSTSHLSHHRHGAKAIAVTDLTILPGRHDLGKLAQRNAGLRFATIIDRVKTVDAIWYRG